MALALAIALPGASASEVSVSSAQAAPGSSVLLTAMFSTQESLVSGMQFDLQYDPSVMSVASIAGGAARSSGKSLYYRDLAANQARFLITGVNQNLIPAGVLVTLLVNLKPTASTGTYPLAVSNFIASDRNGVRSPVTSVNGSVEVQGSSGLSIRLQTGGVLNAASLLSGPVAAGEVITLIGSSIGPVSAQVPDPPPSRTELAGTRVFFGDVPAPLLYAAPNQINAIVPYGVAGATATQLRVTRGDQTVAELSVPVTPAVPAIFTQDSSGLGAGAILNEDGTTNTVSNPAARGSIVVLFVTGAGLMSPPGVDGQVSGDLTARPELPVSVQIGGIEAEILYAGPAPGLVSGVLQVNCQVPLLAAAESRVPIVMTLGTVPSQAGVTLAVK